MAYSRIGFAQVEPNHMSGMVTGQIFAQAPVDSNMGDIIENGRFAKYNLQDGIESVTTDSSVKGPWMMIYNEEKLYDERYQSHKDFAMISSNYTDGEMVPRLVMVLVGDIFTTNAFAGPATSNTDTVNLGNITLGAQLGINENGWIALAEDAPAGGDEDPEFTVVKIYTMADGQTGIKLMRTK